jgi:hypothetical protein
MSGSAGKTEPKTLEKRLSPNAFQPEFPLRDIGQHHIVNP